MNFIKKHLVLIICIAVAVAAIGAGIWFLANPEKPETPDSNTTQSTEQTGDLDLDADMGFGNLDVDNGSGLLPDGNTSSGDVKPITPDNQGNQGNQSNQGNQGEGNQGDPESNTVEMSGSVVENPFK